MSRFKVIVADEVFNSYEEEKTVLEKIGAGIIITKGMTGSEFEKACIDADGILVNLAPIPAGLIEKLDRCKVIARYGVGYDNVDVDACTRKGIYLANVPDYCEEEVSDQALALLMACARKVARRDAQVRAGEWSIGNKDPIYRIAGKTIAFLGFGMIARCLHRKVAGLGFSRIMVYDPFVDAETIKNMGAEKVEWQEALGEADFISVHMPLNNKTRGIIDAAAFDLMKATAIIVNTSRGPVIDEKALIDALTAGKINSAGLDVHDREPLDKDSPLMDIDNCVLSDHVGWYSEESISELKRKAAENIMGVLQGGVPKYPVNTPVGRT